MSTRLLKQPNRWTCLPTCLAILLNKSLEEILSLYGHDGSEIINPDISGPSAHQGFDIPETMEVLRKLNLQPSYFTATEPPVGREAILSVHMPVCDHAVFWDGELCIEPLWGVYRFKEDYDIFGYLII